MKEEEWRDIPNYEGLYQASNLGRVRSLDSSIQNTPKSTYTKKGRVIRQHINKSNKYLYVGLSKNGKKSTKAVHQLIAAAFLNHTPCGYKLVVNHINFDRADNRLENLEIVTSRENNSLKNTSSSSKYTGAYWEPERGKWRSSILHNGKSVKLGRFKCELAAAYAYQKYLREHVLVKEKE